MSGPEPVPGAAPEAAVTAALAAWAARTGPGDLPPDAVRLATDAITDGVGCALAGSREPLGPMVRAVIAARPADPAGAWLVGTTLAAAPADAALHNGAAAHALDYDDTNHPAYAHPSAVLVPVLLACAPRGVSGPEALAAYVVGLEVFGKLGRALNVGHYARGWHPTATFGAVAAAAAAGRLLRLPAERLAAALGLAASAAGGLRAGFGTMTKPLHAGYAARNGVLAALLAEQGVTAAADGLGHRFGFLPAFAAGGPADREALGTWGAPLEILTPYGLALKPYPSCGATHPGIEAAIRLATEEDLRPEAIRAVRVGVCEMALQPLIHDWPATPLQGKFSMRFCVGSALARRAVTLDTFSEAVLADPAVRRVMAAVTVEVDDRVRHDPEFATAVRVETRTGRAAERLVPLARGKPARWLTRAELEAKFRDCAGRALAPGALDEAFAAWQALPAAGDLRPLVTALARGVRP
jgi:2-methylcitrate dehydratase PrpD